MKKDVYELFLKYLIKQVAISTIYRNLDILKKLLTKKDIEKALKHKKLDVEIPIKLSFDDGFIRYMYTQYMGEC